MLSKCANPSCATPLVYLREGKVFMMESAPATENAKHAPGEKSKTVKRVEHFWLCGPCSANLTLARDDRDSVKIVPKKLRALAAAS